MKHGPIGRGVGKQDVLIVADDITGALDTAGYFATPENPIKVWLDPPPTISGRNAIDLDTRDLDEGTACSRVADIFAERKFGLLSFKKIDSVMRGHPIAEAIAAFRAGRFERALFAPAFPAMDRVTINGRQWAGSDQGLTQVGPALADALLSHGVPAGMIGDGAVRSGFVVANAKTDADLQNAVADFDGGGNDIYVGTAGLASVLATGAPFKVPPPILDFAICGTDHPVTRRQIAAIGTSKAFIMDGGSTELPEPPALLAAPTGVASDAMARLMIERSLDRLVATIPRPQAVLVTGGWTLRLLARICGARYLRCEGLYEPGVGISRMVGGAWEDTLIVSKSGGFGGEDLLVRLLAPAQAYEPAGASTTRG
ncbi:four-carbon acid sugar kinase family protein [Mesorhizobium sp. ES1-1]|uniref:four-carbon acid sugar kinase family protein n=1 Tax=Mesorhizobium sp. ES1-1 TaxID=2876629 RepID=UPI001CCF1B92|nr:four-carbon acid sugar kinase family protein [Mesorhizobium sp. ES1-1]MBZ9674697.1 four-carbon acid sugar kinase family protein [Mesorhizobium sp. ES1-1]